MIKAEELSVGYDQTRILKDVAFEVKPGSILTLIGPNGCGKSTLLKSITKQLKTLHGKVYVADKDMDAMGELAFAKEVSMVMTKKLQTEWMSCEQVVQSARYPYTGMLGILSEHDKKVAKEAMEQLDVLALANVDFMKISDGQRQRVLLARALCQETKCLVLDEPTSFLDLRYKLDILSNIRRIARERELAVVMSLHELDLAFQISDRIACVEEDHIGKIGTSEEIMKDGYIQKIFGVDTDSFWPLSGELFLGRKEGKPKVFVIGGGGVGITTYYRLCREDIPFVAGIVYQNDVEYHVAKALSQETIFSKSFEPIGETEIAKAKKQIDLCEKCICVVEKFGTYNQANEELLRYAKETGKFVADLWSE